MITIYVCDAQYIFFEAREIDPMGRMPLRSTLTPPPETAGTEVALWTGGGWEVLSERPPVPSPVVAVPASVTMRQARLALLGIGKLAAVDAAIAGLPEPDRTAAQIEWEYSQEVQRDKPFVLMLAPALGLSEEDLDNLFVLASTL